MADTTGFEFLSNLQAEETTLPEIKRAGGGNGRERTVQDNPFVGWLSETWDAETLTSKAGKAVTVKASQARKTEYLIRQAAQDLGLGVRVVHMVDGKEIKVRKGAGEEKAELDTLHPNKNVKVMFQAQKKRKFANRTRRTAQAETTE
jgi:hypothetical protein